MKRLLVVALVLAGLVAAGLVLFVQLYSPEAQRVVLERRLSEAFGAPAHIGTLRLSLVGGLGVEARDVRVELDPSFGEGSLLEIDEVRANVSVWHFLTSRELGVRSVDVTRPRIRFVKNPDGVWNWATVGAAPSTSSGRVLESRVSLAFATPILADATGTTSQLESVEISAAELTLVDSTVQPPVVTEYRGLGLESTIAANGEERHLTGTIVGDSAADGGEPLDLAVPFDVRLIRSSDTGHWTASGTLAAGRIATRNTRIEAIDGTLTLDANQRLVLPQLRMKMFSGSFEGSASIDLGTSTNRFGLQGTVTQLDLTQALAPKPELAGLLIGTANASVRLTGDLGNYTETVESLEGEGTAEVDNFRIENLNLLGEISKRAKFTLLDFSETGTTATRLTTGLRFERGSVRISNASGSKLNGCIDMTVREGRIGLGREPAIDLTGTVTILPDIQQRVRAADPATQILLAALVRKSGVTIPLRIRGTLAAPSVDLDWSSVARSLLFGAVLPGT